MRYGCIPIVRKVGGLADTVENFNSKAKTGNGFVFDTFDEFALYGEIVRAIELYTNKTLWKKLQINAMKSDYSWEFSAKEYEKLYSRALLFKNKRYKFMAFASSGKRLPDNSRRAPRTRSASARDTP